MPTAGASLLREVLLEQLARIDDTTAAIVAAMQDTVPGYAQGAAADLASGVRSDLERALNALLAEREPTEAELAACEAVGAQRAEQGVALDAMLHAFRVALREGLAQGTRALRDRGADAALLLALSERSWAWADIAMERAAAGHHRAERQRSGRDLRDRDTLLRALAYQQLTGIDLHDLEDLVALWWALTARTRAGRAAPGEADPQAEQP